MTPSEKLYPDDGPFRIPLPGYMERRIKEQLKDNKAATFKRIEEIASGSDKNITLSLLCDTNVPISAITEGFGIDVEELIEIRHTDPTSIVSCLQCQVHLPDDDLVAFREHLRSLRRLGRFDAGALVDRDLLYGVMCAACANAYRNAHAEQLRAEFLARKKRLGQVRRIARRSLEEYYQTPEFGAKSKAAKIRAGNRCQACGRSDVQLETHHNSYERVGEELPADLVVLCRDCHQLYHDHQRLPGVA